VHISKQLAVQLDFLALKFNHIDFIEKDPISIPHLFSEKRDIEISGFIAATIAWGNRTSIINSARKILEAMDFAPYQFIMHHSDQDLQKLENLGHRTFRNIDLLYFIAFLKHHYSSSNSLESAFDFTTNPTIQEALTHFHNYFFQLPFAPQRTRKHVSTPSKGSACKRLNMFLRWMVRNDQQGVDFGIWNEVSPAALIMPLDVHVVNSVSELLNQPPIKPNWKNAVLLTNALKELRPEDPVYYDYALFGYGIANKS
jgi:uncharacterized protein (TIGR02757 family)